MVFSPQLTYILTWQDLYLGPLYMLLLFVIVYFWRKKKYRDSPLKKYIFPALACRMVGCILLALLFNFYYGYGDTFSYYTGAHEIWNAFTVSPKAAWEMVLNHPKNYTSAALEFAEHSAYTGFSHSHYMMFKIAGVTGMLGFGSYLPIALIFSLLSFLGTWMIFLVFNEHFPAQRKFLAITTLFIPTIVVWTNGILKEPICMFALGLCFYTYNDLLKGRRPIRSILFFLFGALILINLKDYLLYMFLVGMVFWTYKSLIRQVPSSLLRTVIKSGVYALLMGAVLYFFFSEDNLVQNAFDSYFLKAENLQNVMVTVNFTESSGSGYTLPTNDFSSWGILQSLLLSINVSLFRPYVWECTNPLMFLSFFESFATTLFVLYLLFRAGPVRIYKSFSEPAMLFSLIFSLLMAALVGFISFNFGTLTRYKAPFEPFFYSMLVVIAFARISDHGVVSKK